MTVKNKQLKVLSCTTQPDPTLKQNKQNETNII